MKQTIKHSCGHETTQQFYGKHSEREWKIANAENSPCWECEKKHRAEEATEANKGLVALTGSEKQIAWAEQIRQIMLKNEVSFNDIAYAIDDLPAEEKTKITDHFVAIGQPATKASVETAREAFKNEASAKFWIENRQELASGLIVKLIKIN